MMKKIQTKYSHIMNIKKKRVSFPIHEVHSIFERSSWLDSTTIFLWPYLFVTVALTNLCWNFQKKEMSGRQNVFSSHNLGLSRTGDYIPEETKIKLYNANKEKIFNL